MPYFCNFIFQVKSVGAQIIQTSHQGDLKKTKKTRHVKWITPTQQIYQKEL